MYIFLPVRQSVHVCVTADVSACMLCERVRACIHAYKHTFIHEYKYSICIGVLMESPSTNTNPNTHTSRIARARDGM